MSGFTLNDLLIINGELAELKTDNNIKFPSTVRPFNNHSFSISLLEATILDKIGNTNLELNTVTVIHTENKRIYENNYEVS